MTFEDRVRALEPLGFTPRQTRFMVTIALHGGYCLRRHYQEFAGIEYGKSVREFFEKLVARRLAVEIVYRRDRGYLYHLHAWSIYRTLGQDDNRNRRKASPALIARKLMLLDYVLSVANAEWFATEEDKVALFTGHFHIPADCLPRRTYIGSIVDARTTRYFVHKLPIALVDDGRTVLFVHLVTDSSGRAFSQFLADHALLFERLPAWTVVAVSPPHLAGHANCDGVFRRFLEGRDQWTGEPTELSWYFSTRRKVEQQDFSRLPIADIHRFRDARQRFAGGRVEALYQQWIREGDAALRSRPALEQPASRMRAPEMILHRLPRTYEQFGSLAGVC